jgi:hypothetical protein
MTHLKSGKKCCPNPYSRCNVQFEGEPSPSSYTRRSVDRLQNMQNNEERESETPKDKALNRVRHLSAVTKHIVDMLESGVNRRPIQECS